jgi:hypothetical protein
MAGFLQATMPKYWQLPNYWQNKMGVFKFFKASIIRIN